MRDVGGRKGRGGKVRGGERGGKTDEKREREDVEDDAELLPLDEPVPPVSEMMLSRSLRYT